MDDAARVLVLANRTAGSPQLRDALLDRREQGPIEVTLLVPAAWEVQDPHGGVQSGPLQEGEQQVGSGPVRRLDAGRDQ